MAKKAPIFSATDLYLAAEDLIRVSKLLNNKIIEKSPSWRAIGEVYCEGLNTKVRQAAFALSELVLLTKQPGNVLASTNVSDLDYQGKAQFFVDSFWTYLCACLDVTAQLVNVVENLAMLEKDVAFNATLASKVTSHAVKTTINTALNSDAIKETKNYRNCSLHRRHVCLLFNQSQESAVTSTGYSGYTGSTTVSIRAKCICDDPLPTTPTFLENRDVVEWCSKRGVEVSRLLKDVLNKIKRAV